MDGFGKRVVTLCMLASLVVPSGCRQGHDDLHFLGDADLNYYKHAATTVDYPAVCTETDPGAAYTDSPRRIRQFRKDELWDMPLAEAIHLALVHNSRVVRDGSQFGGAGSVRPEPGGLLANPAGVTSIYDPALQESGVLFGNRGVEAALADFDAQFNTSMIWSRSERVQNNRFSSGGLQAGNTLQEDRGEFTSRLEKQMAYGGLFGVQHDWTYTGNNAPGRLFPSVYEGFVRADYRHPLLAGAGPEFTRIAGPITGAVGSNLRRVTGVSQGVVIARINNDIAISDFEAAVRNLIKDVEEIYWDLHLTYRVYNSEVVSRDSALRTWRQVEAGFRAGTVGAADEAQARDNYFENRARSEQALADIYEIEGRLRRLIGLPVNDGRIIRPVDEPVIAEFLPDWHCALAEALTRRVELRRQKWSIKSVELQLKAAQSLVKPQLDFISSYQYNGFGDHLLRQDDRDFVPTQQGLNSAYETITQGDQTSWTLGFEYSMPLGFRSALSQVRNLELQLAKSRATLGAQELEISHGLSSSFQSLDRWYQTAQTNLNRRRAAEKRVEAFEAEYNAGRTTLDLLLRAQISLAQAEIAYHRSLAEYNKAISDVHFRKGTLLEYNNIHLAEGGWKPEAYDEALRRAWERSHAFQNNHLKTEPSEFVLHGPPPVQVGGGLPAEAFVEQPLIDGYGEQPGVEVAPAPAPVVPRGLFPGENGFDAERGGDSEDAPPAPPKLNGKPRNPMPKYEEESEKPDVPPETAPAPTPTPMEASSNPSIHRIQDIQDAIAPRNRRDEMKYQPPADWTTGTPDNSQPESEPVFDLLGRKMNLDSIRDAQASNPTPTVASEPTYQPPSEWTTDAPQNQISNRTGASNPSDVAMSPTPVDQSRSAFVPAISPGVWSKFTTTTDATTTDATPADQPSAAASGPVYLPPVGWLDAAPDERTSQIENSFKLNRKASGDARITGKAPLVEIVPRKDGPVKPVGYTAETPDEGKQIQPTMEWAAESPEAESDAVWAD